MSLSVEIEAEDDGWSVEREFEFGKSEKEEVKSAVERFIMKLESIQKRKES